MTLPSLGAGSRNHLPSREVRTAPKAKMEFGKGVQLPLMSGAEHIPKQQNIVGTFYFHEFHMKEAERWRPSTPLDHLAALEERCFVNWHWRGQVISEGCPSSISSQWGVLAKFLLYPELSVLSV